MMDSQEKALSTKNLEEQGVAAMAANEEVNAVKPEETQAAPEVQAAGEDAAGDNAAPQEAEPVKVYKTKQEVLERLKEIAHGEDTPKKEEVDSLKTVFYKLHFAQREADMKAYLDNGGDPEKYQMLPDEDEEVFKAEMGMVKERRPSSFRSRSRKNRRTCRKSST